MHKTVVSPDVSELNDTLLNWGHPEIRVPATSSLSRNPPWIVYVKLMFTGITQHDITDPASWRKGIHDTVAELLVTLRGLGWIRVGNMRLTFDSEFKLPSCTLDQKLVLWGEEGNLSAELDFELVPITGELVDG